MNNSNYHSPYFIKQIFDSLEPNKLRNLKEIGSIIEKYFPHICTKNDVVVFLRDIDDTGIFYVLSALKLLQSVYPNDKEVNE